MPEYQQGKYIAVVESQGFDRTTNGKEFFGLVVRPIWYVIDGVQGGEKERVTNPFPRTVNFWLTTDKARGFAKAKLKHCFNWEGGSWADLSPDTPGYTDFHGQEVSVINTHKPGTSNPDKLYDNFDIQLPRKAEIKNDGDIATRLDRLGGSVATPAPAPAPAPVAAPAPAPAPPATDEVAF